MDWQPIETADKKKAVVVVYIERNPFTGGGLMCADVAYWRKGAWNGVTQGRITGRCEPLCWAPLPDVPGKPPTA